MSISVGQPAAGLWSALAFLGQPGGGNIWRVRGGGWTQCGPGLETAGTPGGWGREDTGGSVQNRAALWTEAGNIFILAFTANHYW